MGIKLFYKHSRWNWRRCSQNLRTNQETNEAENRQKLKIASHNSKFTDSYQTRVNRPTLCTYYFIVDCSRIARISQRGGGGGFFGSLIQPKTNLTKIFISLKLDSGVFLSKLDDLQKKKVFPKIQWFFSAEIKNSRFFFRPNTGDLQTKKKGLHRNSKGFSGRNQKFKGLFPAEIRNSRVFFGRMQVIKKKKKSPPKFKRVFPAEIRNSRVFLAECRWSPKKKVFPEIQRVFRAEIRNSKGFSGRNQWSPKNRSPPTLGELLNQKTPLFWSKQRQVLDNFGSQISLGGLFSFLEQKSASKALETCYFAYFPGQLGRLEPPALPPGYATGRLSTTVMY